MKIIFAVFLLTLSCSNIRSVDYLPAVPDDQLTCCKQGESKVALFIRGVDPVILDSNVCKTPYRLFYKIVEYSDGETVMEIVCKDGRQEHTLEIMGRID